MEGLEGVLLNNFFPCGDTRHSWWHLTGWWKRSLFWSIEIKVRVLVSDPSPNCRLNLHPCQTQIVPLSKIIFYHNTTLYTVNMFSFYIQPIVLWHRLLWVYVVRVHTNNIELTFITLKPLQSKSNIFKVSSLWSLLTFYWHFTLYSCNWKWIKINNSVKWTDKYGFMKTTKYIKSERSKHFFLYYC